MPNVKVFVEYEPQSRVEGEIQQMNADYPVTEFAGLARGVAPGRTDAREITIFDSVGFALEDYSALRFLHALVQKSAAAPGRSISCPNSTIRRICTAVRWDCVRGRAFADA